ncbi:MAG: T9SS type A sorting domain-containing protein [Paludibacter sp.]|nr:T9SS type A sorting domain-containing protein [Paludibacter sp.]
MKKIILFLFFVSFLLMQVQGYEHLIIYGQSLSTGHQSWPPLSTTAVSGNYMIGTQVWSNFGNVFINQLNPLVANVASTTASLAKNRANMIYAESPIVAAANHIQIKTNGQYQLIATSCGTGGKTIEELSKEHYNPISYSHFSNAIHYASSITSDINCPAIVWMQGEYNYTVPTGNSGLTAGSRPTSDKATYKSLMLVLKENMQSDIMNKYNQTDVPLFITYQAGVQYTRGTYLTIGMAQLEASNENQDVVCAGPVYPVTDRGGHLDSNGYRWFGEILGKVFYRTKVLGEDFKPLQPIEISRTSNPKEVKIRFLVPKLPLVIDEQLVNKVTSAGFELYLNGSKKIITGVRIEGDCVIITALTDLTGDIEIMYAGTNNAGHGNLRDSDDYPAFYNYIDLDKKNPDNTYFYPRDAAETTLRPTYEPRDGDGIIYDKPYPLYNFCVAFYYKLNANAQTFIVPGLENYTSITSTQDDLKFQAYYKEGMLFITSSEIGHSCVKIFDTTGKAVLFIDGQNYDAGETISYDMPGLDQGIYLVNIQSNNYNYTSKISVK